MRMPNDPPSHITGVIRSTQRLPPDTPMIVGNCAVVALAQASGRSEEEVWRLMLQECGAGSFDETYRNAAGLSTRHIHIAAYFLGLSVHITYRDGKPNLAPDYLGQLNGRRVTIRWSVIRGAGHFEFFQDPAHFPPTAARPDGMAVYWGRATPGQSVPDWLPRSRYGRYVADQKKAKKCFMAWRDGHWGLDKLESKIIETKQMTHIFDSDFPLPRAEAFVSVWVGAPGSGKSQPVKQWALQNYRKFEEDSLVAFSRIALMEDWKKIFTAPGMENATKRLKTLEMVVTRHPRHLHIEELQSFPPGWLDMIMFLCPEVRYVTATGDHLQNHWNTTTQSSPLEKEVNSLEAMKAYWGQYRWFTYRLSLSVSALLGIDTFSLRKGFVARIFDMRRDCPIFVAQSIKADETGKLVEGGCTFQSSTGIDIDGNWQVLLNGAALESCSLNSIWTVLTRGNGGLFIVDVLNPSQRVRALNHPIWRHVYQQSELKPWEIFDIPDDCERLPCNELWGAKEIEDSDRFDQAGSNFRMNFSLQKREDVNDEACSDPSVIEPTIPTKLPRGNAPINWTELQPLLDKTLMELHWDGMEGDQFNDEKIDVLIALLFPHQHSSDPTMLRTAVKKRLRFRSPAANKAHYEQRDWLGALLLNNFLKHVPIPSGVPFDEELMWECVEESEVKMLSKSKFESRSDPDQPLNQGKVFTKQQLKAKGETIAFMLKAAGDLEEEIIINKAKPGQTLVLLAQRSVALLGWVFRYLTALVKRYKPEHVLWLGGMTPSQLDRWAQIHVRVGMKVLNDFSAYDQSCTGEATQFVVQLLNHCNIPQELIALFLNMKLNFFTQFGSSAIMMFTGEAGTYCINTCFDMAYTFTKFDVPLDMPCGFAGDDSFMDGLPPISEDWAVLHRFFTLVSKIQLSKMIEFCSWWFTPSGIIKNPIVLALKCAYKQATGQLQNVMSSYFLEGMYAYHKGDLLHEYLSSRELEAQDWFINFCFANSRLISNFSLDHPDFVPDVIARTKSAPDLEGKVRDLLVSLPYLLGESSDNNGVNSGIDPGRGLRSSLEGADPVQEGGSGSWLAEDGEWSEVDQSGHGELGDGTRHSRRGQREDADDPGRDGTLGQEVHTIAELLSSRGPSGLYQAGRLCLGHLVAWGRHGKRLLLGEDLDHGSSAYRAWVESQGERSHRGPAWLGYLLVRGTVW